MTAFPTRGDVYWISLDPAVGTETQKTRPCVILSNNAQNRKSCRVIIAPITSNAAKVYPFEAGVEVLGRKGKAMLDQLRSIDKSRLGKYVLSLEAHRMRDIDAALKIALALA